MPIVFLTALGDTRTGVEAMKNGAVDYLLKPVDEETLFDAIDRALDRHLRTRKENSSGDGVAVNPRPETGFISGP